MSREKATEILRNLQQLDLGGALALDVKRTVVRGPGLARARPATPGPRRRSSGAGNSRAAHVREDAGRHPGLRHHAHVDGSRAQPAARHDARRRARAAHEGPGPGGRRPALRAAAEAAAAARLRERAPFADAAEPDGADEAPFVFEVDRDLARVHWEMMASDLDAPSAGPLAVRKQVARQLRTEYSPPPAPEANPGKARRALVIGDPGDPAKGQSLPGARREALRVAEILQAKGLEEVACYVGARDDPDQLSLGVPPPPASTCSTGCWKADGTSSTTRGTGTSSRTSRTARDGSSRTASHVPRARAHGHGAPLVVANACLSSLTSSVGASGSVVAKSDAQLVASLADEFFRRG